jgi:hypothetical protein
MGLPVVQMGSQNLPGKNWYITYKLGFSKLVCGFKKVFSTEENLIISRLRNISLQQIENSKLEVIKGSQIMMVVVLFPIKVQ